MIEALLLNYGLQGGLKLSRGVILALVIGALFATGGIGFWRGLQTIERMEMRSAKAATEAAEATFRATIEAQNTAVEKLRADSAIASAKVSAEAEAKISGLQSALSELEKKNAALPNGAAGGLDRARVRLLRD